MKPSYKQRGGADVLRPNDKSDFFVARMDRGGELDLLVLHARFTEDQRCTRRVVSARLVASDVVHAGLPEHDGVIVLHVFEVAGEGLRAKCSMLLDAHCDAVQAAKTLMHDGSATCVACDGQPSTCLHVAAWHTAAQRSSHH